MLLASPTWSIGWEEDWDARLDILGESKKFNQVWLDLWSNSVVKSVAIPNAELVNSSNRKNDSSDFIIKFKLLTDKSQDQIFPNLVGISFRELESKWGTLLVLRIFPFWLDALLEQVNCGTLRHFVGSFHVLIEAPELINSIEVGKCLNLWGVPTIWLILSIDSKVVAQSTVHGYKLKFYKFISNSEILTRQEVPLAHLKWLQLDLEITLVRQKLQMDLLRPFFNFFVFLN